MGTDADIDNAFVITSIQSLAFTGVLTGVIIYSSIAFFISLMARSAGPALGITIIYPFFESMTTRTLRGFEFEMIADCSPLEVAKALFNYNQYFPEGSLERSRVIAIWDTNILFAAGIGWTTVFVIVSWLIYRKRDL